MPDNLPVTDVGATFIPLVAALILAYREEKFAGVRRLLKRIYDFKRIKKILVFTDHFPTTNFIYSDLCANALDWTAASFGKACSRYHFISSHSFSQQLVKN